MHMSGSLCRAPWWKMLGNQEDVDYVPPLTVCWQPNPVRIVWPEKTHQWGNLLIFSLPMFSLPELFVSFCSLPLFYLQAEGSIETLLHWLVPIFKEARLTLMHLHHFSGGTIWVEMIDKCNYEMKCVIPRCHNAEKTSLLNIDLCSRQFLKKLLERRFQVKLGRQVFCKTAPCLMTE